MFDSGRLRNACLILVAILAVSSCTSRYSLNLYLTADEVRKKADVQATEYVKNAVIGDLSQSTPYEPGKGNVAVIVAGRRGRSSKVGLQYALTFDENLNVKLFLQLPEEPEAGSFSLANNSELQVLGRFDQDPQLKLFAPSQGSFTLDSLRKDMLYLSVDGTFTNSEGHEIKLDGQFKMRIHD